MLSDALFWHYEMQVLMGPFYTTESLNCTNGVSACLKAASLIQWAYFGSKMASLIQPATAPRQLVIVLVFLCNLGWCLSSKRRKPF